jgi:hypothetical protein
MLLKRCTTTKVRKHQTLIKTLRTLNEEQMNRVPSLTIAGATAYTIAVQLRHGDTGEEENHVTVRDVVNA